MAIRLPYNDRVEAQVLGCLLRDDKVFWQISEVLEPDDFHVSDYQTIYRICIDLLNRRRPINPVTVADALAVAKDVKITVEDLDALADDVISPRSIVEYARTVAGHAQVRSVMRAMMDAQEMLSNLDATADREAAIIEAEGMIFQASKRRARNSGVTLDQAIGDVLQDMDAASRTDISERGFSWGLPEADDIAGRLIPGWMYLLAGAAGSGKTALAAQALESIAMKGPVVAYSHEMAPHDHATRALAKESHVSAERIQNYTASPREIESLERIKDEFLIRNRNIIIEPGRKTIFQIKAHAMRIKHSRGLLAIAIDHARLVLPSDPKMKDHEQAGEVSLEAKEIAKDLGIPVILLAQLKQAELAGRANNRPRESDVYGGGAPVQNCDTILMVHRQALYHQARKPPSNASAADLQKWEDEAERTKGAAELITGKRRSGRGHQSREVYFDGPRTRFQSWTEKMRAENTSANMTATDYDDAERLM